MRPSKSLNAAVHWKRDNSPEFFNVIEGLDTPTTAAAVFDNSVAAESDLGLSVNISSSTENAERCCVAPGIRYTERLHNERSHVVDDVRPRDGQRFLRKKDDRLGERRPAYSPSCRQLDGAILLLRRLQCLPRDPGDRAR